MIIERTEFLMAKKLQDLMLKNDDNGRQIRCLLVEDYLTTSIKKVKNRDEFPMVLAETDEMFITKIYEPTIKERENLLKVLQVHQANEEEAIEIPEEVVLFTMLQFTDLELDSTDFEDNRGLLEAILENPNTLFMSIKNELDLMFIESIAMALDMKEAYRHLPDEWLALSDSIQTVKAQIEEQEKALSKNDKKVKKLQKQVDEEISTIGDVVVEAIQ